VNKGERTGRDGEEREGVDFAPPGRLARIRP